MKPPRKKFRDYILSLRVVRPLLPAYGKFKAAIKLQVKTTGFVLRVILPLILRTRKRPVLFSRYIGLGDIICTFPAVYELKKRHAGASFIYSCYREYDCLPPMAGVTAITASFRSEALESTWGWLFRSVYRFEFGEEKQFYVSSKVLIEEFCRQFDVAVTNEHPPLKIAPEILAQTSATLKGLKLPEGPLIIIHAGPSWPIREWPKASWTALVKELQQQGFANIIQMGASNHPFTESGEVSDMAIPGIRSLVDNSSLHEAIALISLCDLFIGIDSGLLHIAASLRKPALGIFGPTSPQLRFSPKSSCTFMVSEVECQGCHHRLPCLHWIQNCPHDIRCMKSIPPEQVALACLARLK